MGQIKEIEYAGNEAGMSKKIARRISGVGHRLSPMERLGLAYCRLEGLHWDEYIGPKPKGWDNARDDERFAIVQEHLRRIETILGKVYLDRCRWVYDARSSEQSWIEFRQRMYLQDQQRFYAEYTQAMPMPSRQSTYQPSNAVDHTGQGKKCKQGRDKKLKLIPSFIGKLFFK